MHVVPNSTDVIVVGAGIIGCAIASELTRRGAAVQIVDDRPAGMGATQASAGVLAPFIEARHEGPLLELTSRSLAMFDAFVERTVSESGMAVGYQRSGTLDVALHDSEVRSLEDSAALLARRGVSATLLDQAAVSAEEPQLTDVALGGLLIPIHGFVSAAELTQALAGLARARGATQVEQGRVRRISPSGDGVVVDTARNSMRASAVVVAAGSWSGDIVVDGALQPMPIRPVRGQLLQLKWCGPALARVIWGQRCYIVPWRDGTVLVGATVEDAGFDERATVDGVVELLEAACELLPGARGAGFTTAKVGLRPASPDELPVIGPSSVISNVVYATGHYRNGVLLAPLTAQLVADVVLERRVDPLLELTKPQRFGEV
jgi:glycine oxidase